MPVSKAIVLYYATGDQDQIKKAKGVFIRYGVRIRLVEADQLDRAVGSFAGLDLPEPPKVEHAPVDESMMIFLNMSTPKLYTVLTALDHAGVPRATFKSILTADNARWSFYQLYDELRKERAAMHGVPVETAPQEEAAQPQA